MDNLSQEIVDPSINLIYDVISCMRGKYPQYTTKFSIIAGKEIILRYCMEESNKEDHAKSNLDRLTVEIVASIYKEYDLSMTKDDFYQILKCIVTCEGKYSVMDRLKCYFWFVLFMGITDEQKEFVHQCLKDMDSESFIKNAQENHLYPIQFFLAKSI